MAQIFDLQEGDALSIGGGQVLVTVRPKTGRRTKLAVEAPRGVLVERIRQVPPAGDVVAGKGWANKESA